MTSRPELLPPGTPLTPGGVGEAGPFYATWTWPPPILWQGWVATGAQPPDVEYGGPGWLTAVPSTPPADAGPPPQGGGTYIEIRVLGIGGWLSSLSTHYP
jgi:hypothetical protein